MTCDLVVNFPEKKGLFRELVSLVVSGKPYVNSFPLTIIRLWFPCGSCVDLFVFCLRMSKYFKDVMNLLHSSVKYVFFAAFCRGGLLFCFN